MSSQRCFFATARDPHRLIPSANGSFSVAQLPRPPQFSAMITSALFALGGWKLIGLVLLSLFAGIGISAVGPGGVLMTIALFCLTDMSPSIVAGTAIVSHVATGAVGTMGYQRNGHFRQTTTRRIAGILGLTAVIGIPLGMWINAHASRAQFGLLLGILSLTTGLMVLRKQRVSRHKVIPLHPHQTHWPAIIATGLFVSAAASLFGIGGPMVCVPLLVILGMPMLTSLAAAQAQSVVISLLGTIFYMFHNSIDWPMAIAIMIPQTCGVLLGIKIAHALPGHWLAYALAAVLILLAPYLDIPLTYAKSRYWPNSPLAPCARSDKTFV
jgi:uncharacterized membrane protein YfcA